MIHAFKFTVSAALVLIFVLFSNANAQSFVSKWGTLNGLDTWVVLNDSTTPPGEVIISGDTPPENWATITGAFDQSVDITSGGLTIKGKIVVEGRPGIGFPIRFGVFNFDNLGTLNDQYRFRFMGWHEYRIWLLICCTKWWI